MLTKSFQVDELKADIDGREIKGYGARFGSLDEHNDVIIKGAFQRSIRNRFVPPGGDGANEVRNLWNHNTDFPIGRIQVLREDDNGLYFESKLIEGVAKADEALRLIDAGAINKMSFGYDVVDSRMDDFTTDTGEAVRARFLEELKLYEISPVTFAANNETFVDSKSIERLVSDVRGEIKEGRMLSEANMRRLKRVVDALREPLTELEGMIREAMDAVDKPVDLNEGEDDGKANEGQVEHLKELEDELEQFANSI